MRGYEQKKATPHPSMQTGSGGSTVLLLQLYSEDDIPGTSLS